MLFFQTLESRVCCASPDALEQYMLDLINNARANPVRALAMYGLDLNEGFPYAVISAAPKPKLTWNPKLNEAAERHARWIIDNSILSHNELPGTPWSRVTETGYSANLVLENAGVTMARGVFFVARQIIERQVAAYLTDQHLDTREHRVQMLHPDVTEAGVAVVVGSFNSVPSLVSVIELAQPRRWITSRSMVAGDSAPDPIIHVADEVEVFA